MKEIKKIIVVIISLIMMLPIVNAECSTGYTGKITMTSNDFSGLKINYYSSKKIEEGLTTYVSTNYGVSSFTLNLNEETGVTYYGYCIDPGKSWTSTGSSIAVCCSPWSTSSSARGTRAGLVYLLQKASTAAATNSDEKIAYNLAIRFYVLKNKLSTSTTDNISLGLNQTMEFLSDYNKYYNEGLAANGNDEGKASIYAKSKMKEIWGNSTTVASFMKGYSGNITQLANKAYNYYLAATSVKKATDKSSYTNEKEEITIDEENVSCSDSSYLVYNVTYDKTKIKNLQFKVNPTGDTSNIVATFDEGTSKLRIEKKKLFEKASCNGNDITITIKAYYEGSNTGKLLTCTPIESGNYQRIIVYTGKEGIISGEATKSTKTFSVKIPKEDSSKNTCIPSNYQSGCDNTGDYEKNTDDGIVSIDTTDVKNCCNDSDDNTPVSDTLENKTEVSDAVNGTKDDDLKKELNEIFAFNDTLHANNQLIKTKSATMTKAQDFVTDSADNSTMHDYCNMYCLEKSELLTPPAVTVTSGRYFAIDFTKMKVQEQRTCRISVNYEKFLKDYIENIKKEVENWNKYQKYSAYYFLWQDGLDEYPSGSPESLQTQQITLTVKCTLIYGRKDVHGVLHQSKAKSTDKILCKQSGTGGRFHYYKSGIGSIYLDTSFSYEPEGAVSYKNQSELTRHCSNAWYKYIDTSFVIHDDSAPTTIKKSYPYFEAVMNDGTEDKTDKTIDYGVNTWGDVGLYKNNKKIEINVKKTHYATFNNYYNVTTHNFPASYTNNRLIIEWYNGCNMSDPEETLDEGKPEWSCSSGSFVSGGTYTSSSKDCDTKTTADPMCWPKWRITFSQEKPFYKCEYVQSELNELDALLNNVGGSYYGDAAACGTFSGGNSCSNSNVYGDRTIFEEKATEAITDLKTASDNLNRIEKAFNVCQNYFTDYEGNYTGTSGNYTHYDHSKLEASFEYDQVYSSESGSTIVESTTENLNKNCQTEVNDITPATSPGALGSGESWTLQDFADSIDYKISGKNEAYSYENNVLVSLSKHVKVSTIKNTYNSNKGTSFGIRDTEIAMKKYVSLDATYQVDCEFTDDANEINTLSPGGVTSLTKSSANYTNHNRLYPTYLTTYQGNMEILYHVTGLGSQVQRTYDSYFQSTTTCSNRKAKDYSAAASCYYTSNQKLVTTGTCDNTTVASSTNFSTNCEITCALSSNCDSIYNFVYKTVNPSDIFPNGTEDNGKELAANWKTTEAQTVQAYIEHNAQIDTLYSPDNLTYSYVLDIETIKKIKAYNKEKLDYGGYADDGLICECGTDGSTACVKCKSTFLTNLAQNKIQTAMIDYTSTSDLWSNSKANIDSIRTNNTNWTIKSSEKMTADKFKD